MRVLITGGAGFIGSHIADDLLAHGFEIRILDNLAPQVHGIERRRPSYLSDNIEFIMGDIRDEQIVRRAVRNIDVVIHLAALVGVGQSMYQLADYTSVNSHGTATLLEVLVDNPVERLIVASSMSIYGEGLYRSEEGVIHTDVRRDIVDITRARWEPHDEEGLPLIPLPTPESKPARLSSVYALTKYDQERLCLLAGEAYKIPTVALRLFNVYGPRQALSNPYTGVLAIFAARYLNDRPPLIFEDGRQQRDFIHVSDVVRAFRLAVTAPTSTLDGQVLNIAGGQAHRIRDVATALATILDKSHIEPEITREYRVGDIRHCVADISLARRVIGFEPELDLEQGMASMTEWLVSQSAIDRVGQARAELISRGLTV